MKQIHFLFWIVLGVIIYSFVLSNRACSILFDKQVYPGPPLDIEFKLDETLTKTYPDAEPSCESSKSRWVEDEIVWGMCSIKKGERDHSLLLRLDASKGVGVVGWAFPPSIASLQFDLVGVLPNGSGKRALVFSREISDKKNKLYVAVANDQGWEIEPRTLETPFSKFVGMQWKGDVVELVVTMSNWAHVDADTKLTIEILKQKPLTPEKTKEIVAKNSLESSPYIVSLHKDGTQTSVRFPLAKAHENEAFQENIPRVLSAIYSPIGEEKSAEWKLIVCGRKPDSVMKELHFLHKDKPLKPFPAAPFASCSTPQFPMISQGIVPEHALSSGFLSLDKTTPYYVLIQDQLKVKEFEKPSGMFIHAGELTPYFSKDGQYFWIETWSDVSLSYISVPLYGSTLPESHSSYTKIDENSVTLPKHKDMILHEKKLSSYDVFFLSNKVFQSKPISVAAFGKFNNYELPIPIKDGKEYRLISISEKEMIPLDRDFNPIHTIDNWTLLQTGGKQDATDTSIAHILRLISTALVPFFFLLGLGAAQRAHIAGENIGKRLVGLLIVILPVLWLFHPVVDKLQSAVTIVEDIALKK